VTNDAQRNQDKNGKGELTKPTKPENGQRITTFKIRKGVELSSCKESNQKKKKKKTRHPARYDVVEPYVL